MRSPIPDDFTGEYCKFSICWPNSEKWRGILRGLITEPGRGFFWDENTGNIKDAIGIIRQTFDYNLDLVEVIMACEGNVSVALNNIAFALRSQSVGGGGCCGGGQINIGPGGSGSIGVGFDPESELDPDISLGDPVTDPPPTGFETWVEYDDYKCRAARAFVSFAIFVNRLLYGALAIQFYAVLAASAILRTIPKVLSWLLSVWGAGFGTQTGTSFWQALVQGNGGLVATAGVVYAYIGLLATAETVLGSYIQYVEDNQEDLVCRLVAANSAGEAYTEYIAFLDEALDFVSMPADVRNVVSAIIDILYPGDVLNPLFENILSGLGAFNAPCDDCVCDELQPVVNNGFVADFTQVETGHWTADAVFSDVNQRWEVIFYVEAENDIACGPEREVTITVTGGTVSQDPGSNNPWRIFNTAGAAVYDSDDPPPANTCGRFFVINSDASDFQVDIVLGDPCS